jgi:hypothetical protein
MPKPLRKMKRRRFVSLVALSGAALAAAPLSRASAALSRAVVKAKAKAVRPPAPAIQREIQNQEKSLAGQLQTIRSYELPPGSPMAFVFKPLRARRGR